MSDHLNDDGELAATAQRVRAALHGHADRVDPGHDAYARLAERVNEANDGGRSGWTWWLPTPRMAVAFTAVLAAIAGGVMVLDNTSTEDTAGRGEGVAVTVGTTTTAVVPETSGAATESVTDGGTGGGTASADHPIPRAGGIVRDTKAGAAEAFLDFVGIVNATVTVSEDVALVSWAGEGGDLDLPLATLRLAPVPLDDVDRWVVVSAISDEIVIESPIAETTAAGDSLTVTGQGTGFEATVDVSLRAATDGRVLSETFAGAGNYGELAPFQTTVPLVGTDRAWVVVSSGTGADDVPVSFAAVPISFTGAVDDTPYHVVRITESDPDDGLNLRNGPGTGNEIVAVLDRGATVTRSPGSSPQRNGTSIWWPVTTSDGTTGWASSRFLAAADPISDEDLRVAAENVLLVAGLPEIAGRWFDLSPALGVSVFSADTFEEIPSSELQSPTGWTETRPALGGRSLAELLRAPAAESIDIVANPSDFGDNAVQSTVARYFGGLPSATADYVGTDGAARRVHLVFETDPTGVPVVIGLIVES